MDEALSRSWQLTSSSRKAPTFRSRRYTYSGEDTAGPKTNLPVPGSVVIHRRNPRPDHDCLLRTKLSTNRFCDPNCERCPKWGARECLYKRHVTSLAYCDTCPHYGLPGCIFGGASIYGTVKIRDGMKPQFIDRRFLIITMIWCVAFNNRRRRPAMSDSCIIDD